MPKTHHFVKKQERKGRRLLSVSSPSLFCLFWHAAMSPLFLLLTVEGSELPSLLFPGKMLTLLCRRTFLLFPSVVTLLLFLFRIVMSLCTAKEEGGGEKGCFGTPTPPSPEKKPGLCVQIRWQEKQAKRGRKERERETWKRWANGQFFFASLSLLGKGWR